MSLERGKSSKKNKDDSGTTARDCKRLQVSPFCIRIASKIWKRRFPGFRIADCKLVFACVIVYDVHDITQYNISLALYPSDFWSRHVQGTLIKFPNVSFVLSKF